ncbi:unnamed protein product, partial [Rotaria sordida]
LIEPSVGSVVNALINTTLLDIAYSIWQQYELESFPGSMDVENYALFAFDATWTLIQSLQQLCASKINISSSRLSFIGSSYCFDRHFINSNNNVTDRITSLYYSAKNAQSSSNGKTLTPSSDRALLEGINLRIGIIESIPFTMVEKDIDPSGQTTI